MYSINFVRFLFLSSATRLPIESYKNCSQPGSLSASTKTADITRIYGQVITLPSASDDCGKADVIDLRITRAMSEVAGNGRDAQYAIIQFPKVEM